MAKEKENQQSVAPESNGTRVIHIGADAADTVETEVIEQEPVVEPELQQLHQKEQKEQQVQTRQQAPQQTQRPDNRFRDRQRPQQSMPHPQIEKNPYGGVGENLMGVEPTGCIYTISTQEIGNYFKKFFERFGYHGIEFANGRMRGNNVPPMFFIFPKNSNLVTKGRDPKENLIELMGGRARGVHFKLDGKLYNLISPFLDDKNRGLQEAKENHNFCYVVLDPSKVFFRLFKESRQYDVCIVDAISDTQTNIIYRVAKMFKTTTNDSEIEEIVHNLSRV